ncbi:N,N'-diacetyllegionaminic acid synthase [Fundidesulfovibrio magnetotacticus]|uniref:N,N'-diacetyllegionaminic acid synthase n=1 Tax=Fundidesulfovibrio magnetotacticus TaxID=2730080 RepID=A0A6V8M0M0_9BACT|nr:N-acetylneuraminate synthase family protein [Fundidesulfovibrio magnetotacticus]GFK95407.1 N,N'-diacetyllegionaminic acid synthase [Fundidesulfovibrio magnetotacticus]
MKTIAPIRLASGAQIGNGSPCFVVAEIGNNHQGDLAIARRMVEEAARAGAGAVKFQKRDMNAMFTDEGLQMPYSGPNSFGRTYGEHRLALEISLDDMAQLKALAESLGMVFFASAWDQVSLAEMEALGVEMLKISSADLVNVPLLRQAGATGLPVILSTGMSSLEEIDHAVAELRRFHDRIVVLHCNSTYPCPDECVALPVMAQLSRRYGLHVGYSGHEQGLGPSVAAAALGARVVERHFTLDRTLRGTDHQASLDPEGFARMVRLIREAEAAMAVTRKEVFESERKAAVKLRKSIVFARDLPAGHTLTESDLTVKCPGHGISPILWDDVLGRALVAPVRHEDLVQWELLGPALRPSGEMLQGGLPLAQSR